LGISCGGDTPLRATKFSLALVPPHSAARHGTLVAARAMPIFARVGEQLRHFAHLAANLAVVVGSTGAVYDTVDAENLKRA
jgi:hypothetical protein